MYHWHIGDLFNASFHVYVPLERDQPQLLPPGSEERCSDGIFGDLKHPFLDLLYCASSTSVSLIISSASSSKSFSPTLSSRGGDSVQGLGCRLNSLSDGMDNFLRSCNLSRASSLSVGHCLVNTTVVQLCEVLRHGKQLGVHVRVSLLTCAAAVPRQSSAAGGGRRGFEHRSGEHVCPCCGCALVVPTLENDASSSCSRWCSQVVEIYTRSAPLRTTPYFGVLSTDSLEEVERSVWSATVEAATPINSHSLWPPALAAAPSSSSGGVCRV